MLSGPRVAYELAAATVAMAVSLTVPSWAAPQDDPPPVTVTQGGPLTDGSETTFTLTLANAGTVGGLEQGQIDSAVAAAYSSDRNSASSGSADVASSESSDTQAVGSGSSASMGVGSPPAVPPGECTWRSASVPAGDPAWGGNDPAAGSLVVNPCNGPATYLFVPNAAPMAGSGDAVVAAPPPPPNPAVLAQQAYEELTLPSPVARRSPPETNSDPAYGGSPYTWVGLWTWFWVDDWQPVQRTVELSGVSATVTATPTALEFDPGDGSGPVTCAGQGRPWTDADGNEPPSGGGCGYMYRSVTPTGPVTASTSVRWSVAWTSNTGASGAYPDGSSTVASSFLVEQIQVVVDR